MFSFKITEQYCTYFHFLPWMCSRFSSVTQSCLILCELMDVSTPGFPVLHQLLELAQTTSESVMPFNHLFLCHPVGLVVNFCTNYTLIITEALEILIVSRVSLKFIHTVLITL